MSTINTIHLSRDSRNRRTDDYDAYAAATAGQVFGGHTLADYLGRGAFASVWRTDGQSALKIFRDSHERAFKDEAAIYAHVGLANDDCCGCDAKSGGSDKMNGDIRYCLTGTVGWGMLPHPERFPPFRLHPFIRMPLCGPSLHQILKEQKQGLPIDIVRKIARDMFRGLSFLHSRGLVHADIKPANLLLCKGSDAAQTHVVIGDLGSCIRSGSSGHRAGTPEYIAPEMHLGGKATPATDYWSAAATLFEIATDVLLFDLYEDAADSDQMSCDSNSSEWSREDREACGKFLHIAWQLIGKPPAKFTKQAAARDYYNNRGTLKLHKGAEIIGLERFMAMKNIASNPALIALISPMLQYIPESRTWPDDVAEA
jgi:serine/threonine protein kinase